MSSLDYLQSHSTVFIPLTCLHRLPADGGLADLPADLPVEVADEVLPLVAVHEADGVVVEAVAAGRVVPRVAVPALDGPHWKRNWGNGYKESGSEQTLFLKISLLIS